MLIDFPAAITDAPVNGPDYLQRISTGLYWGDAMTDEPGMENIVRPYPSVWDVFRAVMEDPQNNESAFAAMERERDARAAAGLPPTEHGIADTVEQITETFPALVTDPRAFAITMATVSKAVQPAEGGWRWSKWGEYIGAHTPAAEYLVDEPVIEELVVFEIYEITTTAAG